MLIILGTFLRGPNWNFFGPFETGTPTRCWRRTTSTCRSFSGSSGWTGACPRRRPAPGAGMRTGYIAWRELPGILLVLGYFVLLPPLMATTIFRKFFVKMGFIRFMLMANLLLLMFSLPLKMVRGGA